MVAHLVRANLLAVVCLILLSGCASRKAETSPEGAHEPHLVSVPATSDSIYPHRTTSDAVKAIEKHEARGDAGSVLDDYDEPEKPLISDPLEPWNRFWFAFNDIFYLKIAKPVYSGYAYITPKEFRSGLKNLLAHILFPVRFVNSLLQGKFQAAGVEFGRFIINTAVGLGGLIDVAKDVKAVVEVDPSGEDFGQTLGTWGVGHGFYIVWPLIGPSSLRETVGLGADQFLNPLFYFNGIPPIGVNAGLRFNSLDNILQAYEDLNKAAVDPYVATRDAYIQFRNNHVNQ